MEGVEIIPTGELGPNIEYSCVQGVLRIYGNSVVSHPDQIMTPVAALFRRIGSSSNRNLHVVFEMNYFNTPTTKCLYDVVKRTQELRGSGFEVSVCWTFEEDDEDVYEVGKIFREISEIPIELKAR